MFREEFDPPLHKKLFLALFFWGAEGENRRAQPLLADRVGLKPRITEGYERAMGLVAASQERETRRIFGNGCRNWPRRPPPSTRLGSVPNFGGRCPCSPLPEGVAGNVALASISACSRIWSAPVRRACDVKRMAEAVSGLLPREDKAICHARAQSVGEPLGSAVGAGRFNADPQGFRLALLPSGPPTAAMTNARPLPGTRRCISPHVFAAVMARSGRLLSVLRLMAPSMLTHKDHEKDVGAEAAADATVEKRLMPTTGHGRRLSPQAAGVRRDSALTSNVVRLIARRGHVPGGSCGLRGSAARLSPSRS